MAGLTSLPCVSAARTPDPPAAQTLLVTVTGPDRPGVTRAFVGALAAYDVTVLDIEQVVVRGRLTLGLLVSGWSEPDADALTTQLRTVAEDLALDLTLEVGTGNSARVRTGRAAVVVLGAPLRADQVAAVAERIAAHGANIDRIRRLSRYPVTTLELDVSGADVPALREQLALTASETGADIAVAPGGLARRGRRLVVLDVDSTFIQDEVIELIAEHAGTGAEVAAVTERAMRGELDFEESLRARVATLAGVPETVLARVREQVQLTPGAATLVRTLKRLGYTVALVSGGFIEVVQPLADALGIDHARANRLEVRDGLLTGRVVGAVVDRAAKAAALREFADAEALPLSRTVAIGDGANDLDMLAAAGLGIAFNAKPVVRASADAAVNVPYLDSVLHLLGISREEIEEADAADGFDTPAPPVPHGHS